MIEPNDPIKISKVRATWTWTQRIALAIVLAELLLLGGYLLLDRLFSTMIGTPNNAEIIRITSPDGRVDAVLVERNAHATVGFIYLVYVVSAGDLIPKPEQAVFNAMQAEDIEIEWLGNLSLVITYRDADIYNFRNFVYPLGLDGAPYKVRIVEHKTERSHEPSR